MIIRNPYRVTNKIPVGEKVEMARGMVVTAFGWCEGEAGRLRAGGVAARAVCSTDSAGVETCYVVRRREGCRFDTDEDGKNESFTVEG
jgi:hypothetical protein